MKIEDLTQFHLTALLKFNGQRALTETSLSRFLKAEKAIARHALNALFSAGVIKKLNMYEFAIAPAGQELLVKKQMIQQIKKPEPKPRKISTVSEAVGKMVASESTALEDVLTDPPQAVGADIEADAIVVQPETPTEQPTTEPANATKPQPSFDALVRRGLERLNKQLKYQPVTIENKRQKIEMLTSLADTLDGFDRNLSASLREVAADINMLQEADHGLHN